MRMIVPIAVAVFAIANSTTSIPASAAAAKHTELSKLIGDLLTPESQTTASYDDLRKVVSEVAPPNPSEFSPKYLKVWTPRYKGAITLMVHGKAYGADPMTGEDLWHVEIDGQDASPIAVQFTSVYATSDVGNQDYFGKAGFTLKEAACEVLDAGNYAILYSIAYPGKKTAYLEIADSTGAAGTFLSYAFFWRAPESSMLPDDMTPNGCVPLQKG